MTKAEQRTSSLVWALVQVLLIKHNKFLSDCYEPKVFQRGIACNGSALWRCGISIPFSLEQKLNKDINDKDNNHS